MTGTAKAIYFLLPDRVLITGTALLGEDGGAVATVFAGVDRRVESSYDG